MPSKERRYASKTAREGAIYQYGQHTLKKEFTKCYQNWMRSWEWCVAKDRDYM